MDQEQAQSSTGSTKTVPKVAYNELNIGRTVGQGGFSIVSALNSIDLDQEAFGDTTEEMSSARREFARTVRGSKFVIKRLRTDLPEDEYKKGVVDLEIELKFLSILNHPNIIALRATANFEPNRSHFFIILDRLKQTLDEKFNEWRAVVDENVGYWIPLYGYCCSNNPALHANWKERLLGAYNIASAVQYLHSHNIVYRDLKPDNIGFDHSGALKIFDFGLAKRLDGVERATDTPGCEDLFLLTGNTGSLRYMAPEVALDRPYGLGVDAYSFGILFWQICSLQTPYAKYTQKMHAEKVVRDGERPKPDSSWPSSWVALQKSCWNANWLIRPSFQDICSQLDESLQDIEYDEGVVPSATSEIRAKKRKKKVAAGGVRLDIDTRLASPHDTTIKRIDTDMV